MNTIADLLYSFAPHVQYISFGLLILAGFNMPVSEDIVFIISASIASTIVPQNTTMIFAGCFLGAYLSDLIAYTLGRYGIVYLLRFRFFNRLLPEKKVETIQNYFRKYGGKTLFFGRFIPFGVRNVLFMTSGLTKMRLVKFMVIDLCALTVTSSVLFGTGYAFGKNYKTILPYLNRYKIILFGIFLVTLVVIYFLKKKGTGNRLNDTAV